VAYCSQSFAGGYLAVSGGLAVTVAAQSMVPGDWRTFGSEEDFPPLPEFEIALHRTSGTLPTAAMLLEEQLIESVQTDFLA
jgi:hypothetical protein